MPSPSVTAVRHLAIVAHDGDGHSACSEASRSFSHLLVCSTAPLNAESAYQEFLRPTDRRRAGLPDQTESGLDGFRRKLTAFLRERKDAETPAVDLKLKLVLNIHGYSTPLPSVRDNAYAITQAQFEQASQAEAPQGGYDDFVLFIDYAWPSEAALNLDLLRSLPGAIPIPLWALAGLGALGAFSSRGLGAMFGVGLMGLIAGLLLLRFVAYFRDRERAAGIGVYDAVELLRWMHVIYADAIEDVYGIGAETIARQLNERANVNGQAERPSSGLIEVSLLAHSMGAFVATQTVRTLSDVFDPAAIERWKRIDAQNGPFAPSDRSTDDSDPALGRIGELFQLRRLVLASPDIPIWALTSGRSNPLSSSLRRFEEVFLFSNDADIVLRLASTVANSFVTPARSRQGGYRLGNLVPLDRAGLSPGGVKALGLNQVGLNGLGGGLSLRDAPFNTTALVGRLTLVDCTDYQDTRADSKGTEVSRRLSAFTAQHHGSRVLNYVVTALVQVASAIGWGGLDSHGGYFRGPFCLNLMYSLLLYGSEDTQQHALAGFEQRLQETQIRWSPLLGIHGSTPPAAPAADGPP